MRHHFLTSLFLCILTAGCTTVPTVPSNQVVIPEGNLVIQNVRVFDGTNIIPELTVVVSGERISHVGKHLAVPVGAEVIDGAGKTLLPGLIDSHAHVWDAAQLEQSAELPSKMRQPKNSSRLRLLLVQKTASSAISMGSSQLLNLEQAGRYQPMRSEAADQSQTSK